MSNQSRWLEILQNSGATLTDNPIDSFTSANQFERQAEIIALPSFCLLQIEGPDARKFLQGQVTCDINALETTTAQWGAQCNPKGRVIFNFLATSSNDERVTLRIPSAMAEIARQSLAKYIVFSKAQLSLLEPSPIVGVSGKDAQPIIQQVFGAPPDKTLSVAVSNAATVIRLGSDRFECWLDEAHMDSTWQQLNALAPVLPSQHWQLQNIRAGISTVYPQTSEEFVPQTINLRQLDAISFTKGCYTGQEVVARMHYLGKQKKHTYRATVGTSELPQPGDQVYAVGESVTNAGQIVDAAYADENTVEILVCLSQAVFDSNSVFLDEQATQPLQFMELPYSLSDDKDTQ